MLREQKRAKQSQNTKQVKKYRIEVQITDEEGEERYKKVIHATSEEVSEYLFAENHWKQHLFYQTEGIMIPALMQVFGEDFPKEIKRLILKMEQERVT